MVISLDLLYICSQDELSLVFYIHSIGATTCFHQVESIHHSIHIALLLLLLLLPSLRGIYVYV